MEEGKTELRRHSVRDAVSNFLVTDNFLAYARDDVQFSSFFSSFSFFFYRPRSSAAQLCSSFKNFGCPARKCNGESASFDRETYKGEHKRRRSVKNVVTCRERDGGIVFFETTLESELKNNSFRSCKEFFFSSSLFREF